MRFANTFRFPSFLFIGLILLFMAGCGGGGETADTGAAPSPASAAPEGAIPIPTGGAKISGIVKFEGDAPRLKEIDMSDEPVCASRWEKEGHAPKSEALLLGEGNSLGNIFVSIKSGLGAANYIPPSDPVVIDQIGCKYAPHVYALMKGQNIVFKNSDGVLHNVHALPKKNREFNLAMPGSMKESKPRPFKKVESMFRVKCDKHPWMNSYAAVMEHPFFSVTGEDGSFEINGLAAGTYEVEAWHEKMGTRVATVTVAANEAQTVNFSFSRE